VVKVGNGKRQHDETEESPACECVTNLSRLQCCNAINVIKSFASDQLTDRESPPKWIGVYDIKMNTTSDDVDRTFSANEDANIRCIAGRLMISIAVYWLRVVSEIVLDFAIALVGPVRDLR